MNFFIDIQKYVEAILTRDYNLADLYDYYGCTRSKWIKVLRGGVSLSEVEKDIYKEVMRDADAELSRIKKVFNKARKSR